MRNLIVAAALAVLPGCVLTGIDPADLGAKAGAMAALMEERPPETVSEDMPRGGQAVYDGHASFFLKDGPDPEGPTVTGTAILGDAHLTVDFGGRTVTGVMDDFEVAEFLMADLDDDSFQNLEDWEAATGQLVLVDGSMTNPNRFAAGFEGDIRTALHLYRLNGGMIGEFYGPNGEYIVAYGDPGQDRGGFGREIAIDGKTPKDARFDLIAVTE